MWLLLAGPGPWPSSEPFGICFSFGSWNCLVREGKDAYGFATYSLARNWLNLMKFLRLRFLTSNMKIFIVSI